MGEKKVSEGDSFAIECGYFIPFGSGKRECIECVNGRSGICKHPDALLYGEEVNAGDSVGDRATKEPMKLVELKDAPDFEVLATANQNDLGVDRDTEAARVFGVTQKLVMIEKEYPSLVRAWGERFRGYFRWLDKGRESWTVDYYKCQ